MGALAESFGMRQGIKYRGAIKESLEKVLAIDPGFQQGSADRALGRWYFKVPGMFGGDDKKSEAHLRKALAYNEQSIITRLLPRRNAARRGPAARPPASSCRPRSPPRSTRNGRPKTRGSRSRPRRC